MLADEDTKIVSDEMDGGDFAVIGDSKVDGEIHQTEDIAEESLSSLNDAERLYSNPHLGIGTAEYTEEAGFRLGDHFDLCLFTADAQFLQGVFIGCFHSLACGFNNCCHLLSSLYTEPLIKLRHSS